jgi:hypothetical protein
MSDTVDPNLVMPIFFWILGLIICYLLPGIIAGCRKHHNTVRDLDCYAVPWLVSYRLVDGVCCGLILSRYLPETEE